MDVVLFGNWLKEKKGLMDSSIHTYTCSLEHFIIRRPNLEDLEDYNNFLIEKTHKKRCSHFYSVLKAYIEFKITDANLRNKLLASLIKPPIRNDIVRERKHLDEETIIQVINNLEEEKHRVIALIQNLTGVRAGDVLRLKEGCIVPEVYKDKNVLRLSVLGKGMKRNVVFIHDEVASYFIIDYITKNPGHREYYFINLSSYKGRKNNFDDYNKLYTMNYNWFWADLKQSLQIVGIDKNDFATHDFRRCFARRFWEKYPDIHKLQQVLNHADPKVTLRYLEQSGMKNIDLFKEMQT